MRLVTERGIEFVHDVGPVRIHRLDSDAEGDHDLFVGLGSGQKLDNLALADGSAVQVLSPARRSGIEMRNTSTHES